MIILGFIIIAVFSFVLAVISCERELSVPAAVKRIRISKKKKVFGVIHFLKEKIVHYSSFSSS